MRLLLIHSIDSDKSSDKKGGSKLQSVLDEILYVYPAKAPLTVIMNKTMNICFNLCRTGLSGECYVDVLKQNCPVLWCALVAVILQREEKGGIARRRVNGKQKCEYSLFFFQVVIAV